MKLHTIHRGIGRNQLILYFFYRRARNQLLTMNGSSQLLYILQSHANLRLGLHSHVEKFFSQLQQA